MQKKNNSGKLKRASFTVDAALIRELGQTLIGKSHIALGELVKNSFDADSHTCEINFDDDRITIVDDGHGISVQEFHSYWMRIGTTHKLKKRRSRSLNRPMTGSKGLGRLSVQFLADEMELESNCPDDPNTMLFAYIDWSSVRGGDDLQTVEVEWEPRSESTTYADNSRTGTRITLKGLRTSWDADGIENLGKDVWVLRSPFRDQHKASRGKTSLDFHVDVNAPAIEGSKGRFDILQEALFNNWKARVTGTLRGARRPTHETQANFTVEFANDYPKGVEQPHTFRETVAFPIAGQESKQHIEASALDEAQFTILVFKPEGRQPSGLTVSDVRDYLNRYGNVSLYDSGFRLPYYGSRELDGDDWLLVSADQGRRLQTSKLLPRRLRIEGRYLLDLPNPGRIFGAVDVSTNHERQVVSGLADQDESLQIQPGRDRLAPNKSFEQLRDFVRFGLDLYANRYRALADESARKQRAKEPPSRMLNVALATLKEHKDTIPPNVYRDVKKDVVAAQKTVSRESREIEAQALLLAPLATAGIAALALNHELSNDADLLERVENTLKALAVSDQSRQLSSAIESLSAYRTHFNAYNRLFAPLVDPEDRQALKRLPVNSLVTQVVNALKPRLTGLSFALKDIPPNLLFPVGAFIEWSAILQNILFNAWNAMLESDVRLVRFDASSANARSQFLRASDTGSGLTMPLEESGILFEAFERQTSFSAANKSIAIGGQGLGLAIVRMIASSRNVDVAFVEPPRGYSTSIELSWRN